MKKFLAYLFLVFIYLWPKRYWSVAIGFISDRKIPLPLRPFLFTGFAKIFSLNMNEAEKVLSSYQSFNEIFTRKLKADARPLSPKPLISPVDARVLVYGESKRKTMLQVKGKNMSLEHLLVGNNTMHEQALVAPFYNGKFITLYLSPSDYHRIHSPCNAEIYAYSYMPGNFFPVNRAAVEGINNLFNRNERWTTFLQTAYGKVAVVKVAATSVGRIPVNYEPLQKEIFQKRKPCLHFYKKPVNIKKGEELARFELGSTVILLWSQDAFEFFSLKEGRKINYGDALAVAKKN